MADNNTIIQIFEHIGDMKADIATTMTNTENIVKSIQKMEEVMHREHNGIHMRLNNVESACDKRLTIVENKIAGWKERMLGVGMTCGFIFTCLVFVFKIIGVIH